jgi:hypothetical protein
MCERTFFVKNCIKQKHQNCMITTTLESVMRVAMERPDNDFGSILIDAIVCRRMLLNFGTCLPILKNI